MATTVASVRGLSFWYPGASEPALRDVTLDVAAGELLLLCGPSGGGKSTLLRVLQGIVPQLTGGDLAGDVTIVERDATRTRPHELTAAGVTLVYQNPLEGFVADRVEDEIAFGPESLGLPADEVDARVREAMRDVGLEDGRRALATLSGGEQQRVAIAAALALRPRVLLMDEPTAHLDEVTAGRVIALVERVRRARGITVVLAEHRLGLVAPLAERVAIIADGRLRALGAPRTVLPSPDLAALGVPVPRAVAVGARLGIAPAPLTPDELARALAGRSARDGSPPRAGTLGAGTASGADSVALSFANVSFRYPGASHDALAGVTLEVRRGERVALVGPSGAGKSTLARLALGLVRPSSGQVTVLGMASPSTARIAARVGLVVQNPMRQLLAETVEGELALALRRFDPRERARRVEDALGRSGLTDLRRRHPLSLSEGQRRRLALTAATAPGPELLILDEPTLAQDETQRRALAMLVRELGAQGVAVLAITHDREFANDACDRVIAIDEGRVAADLPFSGDPAAIASLDANGIPLADVPATVLALSRAGVEVRARTVDGLVAAFA